MIAIPTSAELREFYPISTSITDQKRKELFDYVKNILFVKMFGYQAAAQIADGTVADNAGADFIGFQKFMALCCAYQEIKDPLVSTNFGAKIIDRVGAISPTNSQKGITVIPLEEVISIHYKIALGILRFSKCEGLPDWGGYFSYKIYRL